MTEYLEDFKKALAIWTRVNPFVKVVVWLLWFISLQTPMPSSFITFVFSATFTILIGGFEYIRLNDNRIQTL